MVVTMYINNCITPAHNIHTEKVIDIRYLNVVWKLNSTTDLGKMYCMMIYQYPFPIEIFTL